MIIRKKNLLKKSLNKGSFLLYNIMYKILRRYIMTTERFNEVVKEQLERIEKLLVKKQAEYNLDADRLSVFKHGASMSKETPEQVLYGFLLKHLISQADMISTGEKYTKELWLEKVTDIMNYNILLLGLLEDDNMFKESK